MTMSSHTRSQFFMSFNTVLLLAIPFLIMEQAVHDCMLELIRLESTAVHVSMLIQAFDDAYDRLCDIHTVDFDRAQWDSFRETLVAMQRMMFHQEHHYMARAQALMQQHHENNQHHEGNPSGPSGPSTTGQSNQNPPNTDPANPANT